MVAIVDVGNGFAAEGGFAFHMDEVAREMDRARGEEAFLKDPGSGVEVVLAVPERAEEAVGRAWWDDFEEMTCV